jgi:DNA replication protein DnaC
MKSEKKYNNLSININNEDNDFLYCWNKFGDRPNKIKVFNSYLKEDFLEILEEYKKEISLSSEVIPAEEYNIINEKHFIKVSDTIYISYIILDKDNEASIIHEVSFFFKDIKEDIEIVNQISIKLDNCIVDLSEEDEVRYNLYTILISQQGLDLELINRNELEDVDFYYNEDTFKSIKSLIKKIKKSNKGLSILYGPRGTGKSTLIYYLSECIDRNIIYIPNNMLDATISNPEFKSFIKKFNKPIIVIDDCEMIFNEIFTKSNIYVNNLLQMIDGVTSDLNPVNIITIFNVEEEEEIDHNLLDCNALQSIVYFDYLNSEEATDLSKHLGHNKKYKTKTRLVDIIKKNKPNGYKKIGLH